MQPARVLVVEDERVVAMHLRQQLSRLGYVVPAMATKGSEALSKIAELLPDIVLMDIHIEGDIDGIETAARIPPELQIPVIYLTAYSEEATLERARLTRPYGYLLKPFSERELHAAIQMVLERRRADLVIRKDSERLEELVLERTKALTSAHRQLEAETAERANAERALQQSQKMEAVGQLTGGIAHDFNNLLQVVIGNLSVVIRVVPEDLADGLPRQLTQKALSAAQTAGTLTQRLLSFARRQPLSPKPVNVNGLIGGMEDMLRRSLGETIAIEIHLDPEVWLTEIDPNQLETMILNLALNSRDAMTQGGKLTISVRNVELSEAECEGKQDLRAGCYVQISVCDVGCGMAPEVLMQVFEPFFTTKEVGKGTGLGLSQVYGFAKQSGGCVAIESTAGVGTQVHLYLPRFQGQIASEPALPGESSANVKGTERILVVEDESEVRAVSVAVLRDMGYQVLEAPDGPSALDILQKGSEHIDMLFTDVVLPSGMNGAVLAAQALAIRPKLRVLFTTGYARNALTHAGRLDSGVELIAKPYTYQELGARVREVFDRRST